MKEFNEEYLNHIKQIIADRDDEKARAILSDLHPADIAELYNDLELDDAEYLNRLLDGDKAADVLMELDEDDRRKLLSEMEPEDIARKYVDHLDSDEAVDLIQELDEEDRDEVLSHIDDVEQAGDIIDLLKYEEDTAGGLMGTEMLVVNENWSMPECIKQLRMQAEDMDEIYYVYVVDNDDRLRGTLPLKELITHPSVSKIKNVMETDPVAVKTDTPLDEVAIDFEKYDLVAMPVIDSIGRLVGHITVDDVMDRVRESSERDYQLASGLSQDVESDDTLWRQTKARLPWLLMGIVGGIGNSLILGNFEQGFVTNPAMALFIPMIGGTGGNVGIQSSAIVVQGLLTRLKGIRASNPERGRRRLHQRVDNLPAGVHLQRLPASALESHHTCRFTLPDGRGAFRLYFRHIRAAHTRALQNRPRPCHRPLHLHNQRHHRHDDLHAHILLADERAGVASCKL